MDQMISPVTPASSGYPGEVAFLSGGGEAGRLIRAMDWSQSRLGPPAGWPQSLRTTLSIVLTAKLPMILCWGPELTCFYNNAFRAGLGETGTHPGSLGKPGGKAWPGGWPNMQAVLEAVLAGGEATWREDQLLPVHRDGNPAGAYWTCSFSPVRDESGGIGGVLVTCGETTTQANTIRSLQLSEQRFQNLVQQATVGIIVLSGEDMVVEIVNDNYGRLIDRTYRELIGRPLFEVIPEAKPYFHPIIEKVRVTGDPLYLYGHPYFVLVNGTRKEGFLDLVYQPYREQDGTITGVMVLCQDVTAQVAAHQKLEVSEAKLRSIITAAPAGIGLFVGRDLVIEMPNQTLVDLMGKGWDIVGKPLREAMPELITEGQPFLGILDQVYTSGKMFQTFGSQVKIIRDGVMTSNYYNFTYTPLFDADGRVYAILDIAVDVTGEIESRQRLEESETQALALAKELAASNEELRAANEEIRASNEELGVTNGQLTRINSDLDNFVYTASHDLKAPISNIEGLMQALLRQLPAESLAPERVQRIVSLIQDSVERFKKTITNLTEIVKLQKEHNREAVLVNLPQIVEEVMLDLEATIQSVGARVTVDVAACPPVRFPEKNLRSVVYNLVSNALKYRSPGRVPQVRVWCESTPAYHILTVSDNGLGIEAGRVNQLFTMFRRFHDHVEGTGIGLFMVKKMVENAGGKITVESRAGEGSAFRVYLPG